MKEKNNYYIMSEEMLFLLRKQADFFQENFKTNHQKLLKIQMNEPKEIIHCHYPLKLEIGSLLLGISNSGVKNSRFVTTEKNTNFYSLPMVAGVILSL